MRDDSQEQAAANSVSLRDLMIDAQSSLASLVASDPEAWTRPSCVFGRGTGFRMFCATGSSRADAMSRFTTSVLHACQCTSLQLYTDDMRSYSALNSQPRIAIAAIRYIHTSSAMLVPMLPYITL